MSSKKDNISVNDVWALIKKIHATNKQARTSIKVTTT